MTPGKLTIHFATDEAAEALRADAAFHVSEIAGGPSLFGELAVALELPDYFGHNWDALDECLREIVGYILLLVHDADTLWRESPDVALALVELWLAAAEDHPAKMELVFVWS